MRPPTTEFGSYGLDQCLDPVASGHERRQRRERTQARLLEGEGMAIRCMAQFRDRDDGSATRSGEDGNYHSASLLAQPSSATEPRVHRQHWSRVLGSTASRSAGVQSDTTRRHDTGAFASAGTVTSPATAVRLAAEALRERMMQLRRRIRSRPRLMRLDHGRDFLGDRRIRLGGRVFSRRRTRQRPLSVSARAYGTRRVTLKVQGFRQRSQRITGADCDSAQSVQAPTGA